MTEVSREVEELAQVLLPSFDVAPPNARVDARVKAQRVIAAGWTPPPDPAAVVGEVLWQKSGGRMDLTIASLRDLFTPEALAEAAAKAQEADR